MISNRLNNSIDICFVILHYLDYTQTLQCIEFIKRNCDTPNYKIIIVDNASSNNSGKQLKKYFFDDSSVIVIINDINYGFSKGNNIGIKYALDYYCPQFICCINNDVLIEDKSFFKKVSKEYKHSKCAVIGPRIILKDGILFRFDTKLHTLKYYKSYLKAINSSIHQTNQFSIKSFIYHYFNRLLTTTKLINPYRGVVHKTYFRQENLILHGCCIVFTPIFFKYYSGFDESTFLYLEEVLLYIMCMEAKIKTVYLPSILIRHLEDCASNKAWGHSKNEIKTKYMISSLKILINRLETSTIIHDSK